MDIKSIKTGLIYIFLLASSLGYGNEILMNNDVTKKEVTFGNSKLTITLDYHGRCQVKSLIVNGQAVISGDAGIYSFIKTATDSASSLMLLSDPIVSANENTVSIDDIIYLCGTDSIHEKWRFIISENDIRFDIDRNFSKPMNIEDAAFPCFTFNSINTWNGAFLGYGGLAWFYLFNSKQCTYGVHTNSSVFWNSETGNALKVNVSAPGKQLAMKYSRSADDKLVYNIAVSDNELTYRYEAEKRSRFIRGKTDVWNTYYQPAGKFAQSITLSYVNYDKAYNRGNLAGENGKQVTSLLNTIARIGVIDDKLFGGNSWHTPYGPICLHEQYIADFAIGINEDSYTEGYKRCLDFYRDHAIQPDGRVISRWAYLNEDAMPGTVTEEGFYEAQWGYLMDSNPDFVTNVAELFNISGDLNWVSGQKTACEKALDYLLKRDSDGDHLVEMKTDSHTQRKGSDWIDIIWASYENAFVNAKLYFALKQWSGIESILGDTERSGYYSAFASELKKSFNKSTAEGGFWSAQNRWYIHWLDKDHSVHGDNLVVPVNLMAVAYGICDDTLRRNAILDKIEEQTRKENLFFWPICLYPYAVGEGNDWQFPFPNYENGDIFLSWGSIGVDAYAAYKPDLALKYVDNVLARYEKDGLAFQRYGRVNQEGLGDDILSGNSLAVVGLYKSIYGINPLFNRLYLNPHLPAKLSGTELIYNFRHNKLKIGLTTGQYSISDNQFTLSSKSNFGFNSENNALTYFAGRDDVFALKAKTTEKLSLDILKWQKDDYAWNQSSAKERGKITYFIRVNKASSYYTVYDGSRMVKKRSDQSGILCFELDQGQRRVEVKPMR